MPSNTDPILCARARLQRDEAPRRLHAFRWILASLAVIALHFVLVANADAATMNATITADNDYSLCVGSSTGCPGPNWAPSTSNPGTNRELNVLSSDITVCGNGTTGPEVYTNLSVNTSDYIYMTADSDQGVSQGILGQFVSQSGAKFYTGTCAWSVCATGLDSGPGAAGFPTVAQMNAAIAQCNAGTGGTGNGGSKGWVGCNGGLAGAGYVGKLAVGEANNSAAGDFGQACPTSLNPNPASGDNIDDAARWMWFNPDGRADPFKPFALPSGEYLIFRAPAVFPQQTFPPKGCDVFPSSSQFAVTIGGTTYSAFVSSPTTTVGRSSVVEEDEEAATPVCTGPCTQCAGTVNDITQIPCWPNVPPPGDETREIHTEMDSLDMCGPTTTPPGFTVCYKAGQPAYNALSTAGAAIHWKESFGEVESQNQNAQGGLDFPADSFFAIRSVVTIAPNPAGGALGVYYADDPILMRFTGIASLPPPPGTNYDNAQGATLEGGAGSACGLLPVNLFTACASPTCTLAGNINTNVQHSVGIRRYGGGQSDVTIQHTATLTYANPTLGTETLNATGTASILADATGTNLTCTSFSATAVSNTLRGLITAGLDTRAASTGTVTYGGPNDPWLQHNNTRLALTMPGVIAGTLVSDSALQMEAIRDAPDTAATFTQVGGSVNFYNITDPTKTTVATMSGSTITVSQSNVPNPATQPVPSLSEWGMILLVVLLFGILTFLLMKRNRQVAQS